MSNIFTFIKNYGIAILLVLSVLVVVILTFTGQISDDVLYSVMLILSLYVMILPIYIFRVKYRTVLFIEKIILICMFIISIPMLGFSIDSISKAHPEKK